jgi:hypothetical protein
MSSQARKVRRRPDATASFFEVLASRGRDPLLHHESGTIRLELATDGKTEYWYLKVVDGDISVSRSNATADAVMRTDKKLFEGMTRGTVNVTAALLRGVLGLEGDLGLLTSFARLFPGPPRSRASFLERQKGLAG